MKKVRIKPASSLLGRWLSLLYVPALLLLFLRLGGGDMPVAPKRPCAVPGCGSLVSSGYCEKHARPAVNKAYERERGSSAQRGYGSRWQKARVTYLRGNPLCVHCQKEGVVSAATVVDHIIPHKGSQKLFWDKGNWQALCTRHHNIKTASEDGGFGNTSKFDFNAGTRGAG